MRARPAGRDRGVRCSCVRQPDGVPGRLRPAAARRRGDRQRRLPRDGRVRRRPRPGAAVGGQGQRRHGRSRRRRSRWTAGTRGSRCGCKSRCTCPTTRWPSCARPACSARSSSRCRRPPTEPPQGRLGDGDTIPLRALRPEPGGRGGPLRAVPGAQRRRRRPAQDHQRRAHQGDGRARGGHPGRRSASSTPSSAAWTQHKSEVVRALDGLDRLSARLAAQKGDIATAIDNLGPG